MSPKLLLTQRLPTDLEQFVGVTTVTKLVLVTGVRTQHF